MFRLQTRDNNFAAATDITKSFFKIRATEKNRFRMSNTVCGWRRADLRPDYRGSQKAELIHRESQRPDCRIENGILGWSYYCGDSLRARRGIARSDPLWRPSSLAYGSIPSTKLKRIVAIWSRVVISA